MIGLKYNNQPAIAQLCATGEPMCHETMRLDIIYGNGMRVSRTHSIVNRLQRLLMHLHSMYPAQGWGQYLDGDDLNWAKFVLSGHSQGGGHAALIARDNLVDRVLLLNSPSDASSGAPASWISDPHVTPDSAYFAFIHTEDNGPRRLRVYGLLGFAQLGDTSP